MYLDTIITFTCDKCHTTASFDTAQIHPDDDFRCMACTDGMLHLPAKDTRTMNYTALTMDVQCALEALEAIQTNLPSLVSQRLYDILEANTKAHEEARDIEGEVNNIMRCAGKEPHLLFFNVNHVIIRSEEDTTYFSTEHNGNVTSDSVPCIQIEAKRVGRVWQTTYTEHMVLELPL